MSTPASTSILATYTDGTFRTWNYNPIVDPKYFEFLNAALGLAGEGAETDESVFAGLSNDELISELGDVLYYTARVIDFLNREGVTKVTFETMARLAITHPPEAYEDNQFTMAHTIAVYGGKIAEYAKKTVFHGKVVNEGNWIAALESILGAVQMLARTVGSSIEDVAEKNLAKLAARHGNKFKLGV